MAATAAEDDDGDGDGGVSTAKITAASTLRPTHTRSCDEAAAPSGGISDGHGWPGIELPQSPIITR